MATITLNPGEAFEHYHLHESTTTLLQGELELTVDGKKVPLVPDQQLIIPANTHHVVKNVGTGMASFHCGGHTVQSPPADVY